ncbi:MAG: hypothetical protein NZT92_18870, partial [Abditibacteriales bacterium]|nr:hypothetical protein [Abditibacteriales bacterium]
EQQFSQSQSQSQRNAENAPNRRVVVFLFRPGSKVSAERWPCPRAKEGIAGCQKRFWSDGEKRRGTHLPNERREFEKSKDTFACRFYQRISEASPCEAAQATLVGYLSVQVFFHKVPIEGLEVKFAQMGQDGQPGAQVGDTQRTDQQGIAKLDFPVPVNNYICQIEYQPATVVCTVEDKAKPFILVLPIGRPYFDFEEEAEFDSVGGS